MIDNEIAKATMICDIQIESLQKYDPWFCFFFYPFYKFCFFFW